ncbi:MAG: quinoprotein glucose dehydrogenase [Gammaproteobacteria bacterium]|nr:quinoprotein glucose dehydrogenase [Gammaproteobacteria bacterium]HJN95215.1 PQQ-binding-like beta-propeller repeat protein [Gammaproteobacteria bacterium]|tara:strand:- start:5703 stop:7742 length:2040 start_codon:yes stop_codon:yes gene_type:complete
MNRTLRRIFPVLCLLPVLAQAQQGAPDGEWPSYGGDLGHTRYSALEQIDAANFSELKIAWRFKTDNLGPSPEYRFQATPLMVDGKIYTTAGSRRSVVALDAETGELLWHYSMNEGERGEYAPRQLSGRGLAFWQEGDEARVIYVTPGYQMVALDASSGLPVDSFGNNGVIDLKQNADQQIDPVTGEIGLHATPIVAKDVVIVGAAHRTGGNPSSRENVKGYVRGFDVRTGERLWIYHTIPLPGEYGNESWLEESSSYTGNTGVWAQISVDLELETVYLPVEAATGDYYGGYRPGDNLFAETLLAVDLHSGERKWHFQLVHHGIWDHDIPCAPILADVMIDGTLRKIVAQPTKQAFLYVFDRVTGEPIWPIEERPVEIGDVPGEWYSPTQPFPSKPPAYDRQGVSEDDLIDFTPQLRTEALEVASWYKLGPIFTPPVVSDINGPLGILMAPATGGGTNWPGGSYDPETNMLYVSSNSSVAGLAVVPPYPGQSDMAYIQGNAATGPRTSGGAGSSAGGGRTELNVAQREQPQSSRGRPPVGLRVQRLPLLKPPYGVISAIDLQRGEIAWQIAHGQTPDRVANHPLLQDIDLPRTGQNASVGTLVTKTLLIAGEAEMTRDGEGNPRAQLRAYDKATGADVGAVRLPAPQSGSPMTYMLNDEQYIVIAVSGGGISGELVAFKL